MCHLHSASCALLVIINVLCVWGEGCVPVSLPYTYAIPIQPTAPHPRSSMFVFLCVTPFNQRGNMAGSMGTAHGMSRRDKGYSWLNGHTHMDDRGKGYVPLSLSCTCATPIQPSTPFTLSPMLYVWPPFSQRRGTADCMGTTHNMDGRDNGYDWWMGTQTYGWQSQGYIPLPLSYTRANHSASCFLLSVIHFVCVWLSFNQRRGTTGWMGATHNMDDRGKWYVPMFLSWTHATPFRQPLPFLWSMFFCVWPSFKRLGEGVMAGWMGTIHNMDGRDKGYGR